MTRLEELKAKMNSQPVTTTVANTGTTRLDKLKSNLGVQTTLVQTKPIQPTNYPRWEDQVVALQNKAKQEETNLKSTLPVSATAVKLQQGKNQKYGQGNIDLTNRPVVKNNSGSISTVRSMSFNDGKNEVLVPTVVNGKVVSDDEAIDNYYKTGEYLGKFNSIKEANDYAQKLHEQQDMLYGNNLNKFMTGINPNTVNSNKEAKKELQEQAYNTMKNSDAVKNLQEYASAYNQYSEEIPKSDTGNYLDFKAIANDINIDENPRAKAINEVLADKNKKYPDWVYGLAQLPKTFATSAADAFVNVGQFAKQAFKDQATQNERKAWTTLATFTGNNAVENARRKFPAFKNLSDAQIQNYINDYVADAKNMLKRYNIQVPDNVTPEYAQSMIEELNKTILKENKLEEFTRTTKEKVAQQNEALPDAYKKINSAVGTVAEMTPTIATNAILPGAGMGTLFAGSAQSSKENALNQGASYEKATQKGILSGALEVGTEMIGGENIAKLTGIPSIMNKLGLTSPNKLIQVVMDIGSEGLEEMVSAEIQPFIDRATIDPNAPLATAEDIWNAFEESILPTLMFSGINVAQEGITNYRQKAIQKVQQSNMTAQQKQQEIQQINQGAEELQNKVQNEQSLNNTQKVENVSDIINKPQYSTALIDTNKLNELQTPKETWGYREEEKTRNLENSIKENGVQNPILLATDKNGNLEIYDGHHRLEIAQKYGIKEVPIKYIGSSDYSLDIPQANMYNDDISEVNVDGRINGIAEGNGEGFKDGGSVNRYDSDNTTQSEGRRTTEENDKIRTTVEGYNDGSSGGAIYNLTSERNRINETKNSKQGSFSIPENVEQTQTSVPVNVFEEANKSIQNNTNNKLAEETEALTLGKTKAKTPVDIANMTEEDIKREKGVEYKHKKDKNTANQRKFFENMQSSNIISKDVKERVDMTSYERKANEQTLAKVNEKLDEKGDKLIKEWEKKTKNFTDEDVALGAILIQRYQQEGDIESAVDVVQKLADMGTEVGRAVQMYSIFQRLTPEAMLVYQQRKLNDVFDNIKQKKTGEWVEKNQDKFKLTKEDINFITEQVNKASNAETERQKQIELAKIETRINDKIPPSLATSLKAFRRLAMLFNPKTQVRNVVGNTMMMPANDVADVIGTQIDKIIAKKTGVRTTNLPNYKAKMEGFKQGTKEAIEDYKLNIRTAPGGQKYDFELGQGKSFNENTKSDVLNAINHKLNNADKLLGAIMSGGDRPFYQAAFNNSLQGQMKANNVDIPTDEMIDIAVNEALQRTWNDNNNYTKLVLGIRRILNAGMDFGFGDVLIPFARTPANLTKAMVEYSPVGFWTSAINYSQMKKAISRGEMTAQQQKNFVSSVSKAITGTLIYVLAGALAKAGITTGSKDDDKDVANFEQNVLGIQPYSVKIGDKTYTYTWANPINAPLAIMADAQKKNTNDGLLNTLSSAFKVASDTLVENSFMQGIKNLFDDSYGKTSFGEKIINTLLELPSSYVPTLFNQIATMIDPVKRQTFEKGDDLKTNLNKAQVKIPFAKSRLAPTVNTFGEEAKYYGGDANLFNVFFNPANVSSTTATDTQKELYSLYEATKDKTIFPRQIPYSEDGKNFTSQERAKYQKISGNYVSKNLDALFDSNFYKTLNNDDKIEVVNKIVSDGYQTARSEWIDNKATKDLAKLKDELGDVPLVDYYNAWLAQKDAKSVKEINWLGKEKTIKSEGQAKKEAIDKAISDGLTKEQKERLYGIFNISEKVW